MSEQEAQAVEVSEVETQARAQGWVPKEEFRGNETDWIEAEVFVQRGKEINPILRKNNERITKELEATKRQMEELKKTTEEFKVFQKEAFERKIQKYTEEIAELKDLKRKAVTEGDGDLVVELDDKIDELKAEQAKASTPKQEEKTTETVSPEVQADIEAWITTNSWYKTDARMQTATDAIAASLKKQHPFLVGKEFLDKVDLELAEMFPPEKLGKKIRPRTPVEGASNGGASSKGSKSEYNSLPPEAKAACDKFVKQGILTREQYVADYYA